MTCALKNCKGCIPDREKRRFHTEGLMRPIAALAAVHQSGGGGVVSPLLGRIQRYHVSGLQPSRPRAPFLCQPDVGHMTRLVETPIRPMEICCRALDADFLINLPVLKGHCQTAMTCALKNCKGCIPDREKRRFRPRDGWSLPPLACRPAPGSA